MDLYERLSEPVGRVGGFAAFGAVVGTILAAIYRDIRPEREVVYGEWAAYSAALVGVFSMIMEISRSI